MRKIIIGLLLLLSVGASAQWQQTGSKVRYVNGLGIPTKDTAAGVSADSSQILIRPADSSLYIKYKRTWVKVGSGGTIGGSGTINRVPKFTAGTTIGNSSIVDSASAVAMTINTSGNIGIGTTFAQSRFHTGGSTTSEISVGTVTFSGNANQALASIQSDQNANGGVLYLKTNPWNNSSGVGLYTPQTRMTINDFGNVGIGTTTPVRTLTVSGAAATYANVQGGAASDVGLLLGPIGNDAVGRVVYSNANNNLQLWTNATQQVTILSTGNLGIGYTAPAAKLAVNGTTLINTNTDNGVDKLQVSGSMSVSAKATAQTLSVTSNATVGGTLNVTGIGTFTNRIQVIGGGGIRLGEAGASASLSAYLGGSTDAYPLVNNAYVISGVGWKYLGNGPASVISYESGDLLYYTIPTNSSGADATIGAFTQRYRVTAGGNFGIGTYAAPAAKLAVEGTALINTNTDNTVDKLQVNGSILSTQFKLSALNTAPATASSTGTLGEIRIDANYIYICTATNTWKRVAIATW